MVENASACWASVDESLEWCRITVETLKGDPRHKSILEELRSAKGDPAALFDYLYTASQGALTIEGDQSSPQFLDARSELPAVIKENADLTSACIDLFFDKGGEGALLPLGRRPCFGLQRHTRLLPGKAGRYPQIVRRPGN
ncbi:hypothetical protein BMJ22_15345 [Sinorhizobium medicae]|nr:hypothetical protein BMJ22_15345 [Sinorhizobium medicae]